MPSEAIALCLDEMEAEQSRLTERLQASLAQSRDVGPSEALAGQIGALREHIGLIDSTVGWLRTLEAAGYPGFDVVPPPPDASSGEPSEDTPADV